MNATLIITPWWVLRDHLFGFRIKCFPILVIFELIKGTYDNVYLGYDSVTNDDVQIKVSHNQNYQKNNHFEKEAKVYKIIANSPGIPSFRWSGYTESGDYAIVTELLGSSLDQLLYHCNSKFTMKTILMVAGKYSMSHFCSFLRFCRSQLKAIKTFKFTNTLLLYVGDSQIKMLIDKSAVSIRFLQKSKNLSKNVTYCEGNFKVWYSLAP